MLKVHHWVNDLHEEVTIQEGRIPRWSQWPSVRDQGKPLDIGDISHGQGLERDEDCQATPAQDTLHKKKCTGTKNAISTYRQLKKKVWAAENVVCIHNL